MTVSSEDRFVRNKIVIAAIIFVISVSAVIGTIKYENIARNRYIIPNGGYTDEMILENGYFDILVPAAENRNLPSDVESYCFGDEYVHLVLPSNVSEKNLCFYVRNEQGEYLARRVCDFTQEVSIGPWQIVVDRPSIPTMYFETNNADDYEQMLASEDTLLLCEGKMQICVDKEVARKNGWYSEYLSSEKPNENEYSAALQGRGSSSWDCESKKSFTLRLGKSMNLLGMGSNRNWNLIGSAYDPSLLKNTVFNEISQNAGIKYQPNMIHINLYVDGKYQGVYILTTKMAVSKDRIALGKHDFLYKMDPPSADQPIPYESITWFPDGNMDPVADLVYPKDANDRQKEQAAKLLQRAINAIEDPTSEELPDIIDMDSFVRYYWVQEASMNFDAWQRSVYMYYSSADGKMHLGPVWDMDITLGSPYEKAGMSFDTPEGFRIKNAGWYSKLFERADFISSVVNMYYDDGIRQALLDGIEEFDTQKQALGEDGVLNFKVYGHANQGTTIIYGDDYESYCSNMIDFYKQRIEWIDEMMSMVTNQ